MVQVEVVDQQTSNNIGYGSFLDVTGLPLPAYCVEKLARARIRKRPASTLLT
jgi:hypothetical protein